MHNLAAYTFFLKVVTIELVETANLAADYSCINIATYIDIITIMECQISTVILSYKYTTCSSCPFNIVIRS